MGANWSKRVCVGPGAGGGGAMKIDVKIPFNGPKYLTHLDMSVKAGEWQCVYCGKAVEDRPDTLWAHVVAGGARYATQDEHEGRAPVDEAGDMGCFPVGSDCAARLRKAGVHLFRLEGGT